MDKNNLPIMDQKLNKYNSVRHGVLTKVLLPEEQEEAKTIYEQFIEEYQPQTFTEYLQIESMAIAYVRWQRAINAEREFVMQTLNPPVYDNVVVKGIDINDTYLQPTHTEKVMVKEGYKAKVAHDEAETIDKTYARYVTTCERQYYKALHELQRIQGLRLGLRPTSMALDILKED